MDSIISLKHCYVDYPIPIPQTRSAKVGVINSLTGGRLLRSQDKAIVRALSDISIEIHEGERIALLGHNGSGKSTLLRTLAGIITPTSGKIKLPPKISAIIDRGLGLNVDLSGRENIRVPLTIMGGGNRLNELTEDIIEWADLGHFIDLPMRTYSDGMVTRLLFAILTSVPAEVLVFDEWLGAGDYAFREKSEARINQMVGAAKCLVLSTHDLTLAYNVCTRAILLEHGRVIMDDVPKEVIKRYTGTN